MDLLSRLDTDPEASQPLEWTGSRDPHAHRGRWEQDGSAVSPSSSPSPWRGGFENRGLLAWARSWLGGGLEHPLQLSP
jgi:hypothetical protein